MRGLFAASTVDDVLAEFSKTIKRLENIIALNDDRGERARQRAREAEAEAHVARAESERAYNVAKKLRQLIEAP
jgi:hypothetical protein